MAGWRQEGNGKWRWVWPFLVVLVLHCVAILVFTRGFLLTRTELPFYSNCSDISHSPCISNVPSVDHINNQSCWTRPIVDRVVIIVLDALRFDFLAPSSCFKETKPWMDKLQVLQELASDQGSQARIFKAIADPPTTSLQRLKGLTTGGLPTFIDVGNSFGAPAIIEDNLIYQLVQNGKHVVMMGDDTWLQLFPNHFGKSYPFPSFNVKDLDTVDNGCIDHLLPSLYQEDWDVLIAHFLGVDHAGHIFGVDSIPMIKKLEQYNVILEKVIEVLQSQSEPGGLHENTLLLVMGDHGQTLNGDHGGGTAEEVETSMFAMSFKKPPTSMPSELENSSCELDMDKKVCTSSIQQLDFAVTISALLGIPFPFGSIGHVDSELYALGAGIWNMESSRVGNCQNHSGLEEWMQNYVNVLCINSWQVKRYIDVYSASSVIGFSSEDLLHIGDMYTQAEEKRSYTVKDLLFSKNESSSTSLSALKRPIDAYLGFLASVAELARSKWTEFNLKMMGVGLSIMLVSLCFHFVALTRVNKPYGVSCPSLGGSELSLGLILSLFIVAIRACSFLSNSYILEEGKVAIFLLATTGVFKLRFSIMKKKILLEAIVSLVLLSFLRFTIELGLSKQAATSAFMNFSPSWMPWISNGHPIWVYLTEIVPVLALISLMYLLYKSIASSSCWSIWMFVITTTILNYILIAVHWALESELWSLPSVFEGIGRNNIPQIIYTIGFVQLLLLALGQLFTEEKKSECRESLFIKTVAMLSAWSPTIIILSGKQGPLVALASLVGGYCLIRVENLEDDFKGGTVGFFTSYHIPVTQWSLLAVCLFFCTGHWCAFDGLRYGAAFIGFDEFVLLRQAVLLTVDTFGFSHILPIFGLPFLVSTNLFGQTDQRKQIIFLQLSKVYLMYGMIMTATVTFTMICVSIQRRHLMVWGLFAPKYVFDVVSLLLADALICLASLFYFGSEESSKIA